MKIELKGEGINVAPLHWALQQHPELWDAINARTVDPTSPHHDTADIWARWTETGESANESSKFAWYPASEVLPVRELVYPLMGLFYGERLGGVLITKIPPGKEVLPHRDEGWHAETFEKFAVQIASHPGQSFNFLGGEQLVTKPGDVFWFDNQHTHWVTNPTDETRITLIVCMQRSY